MLRKKWGVSYDDLGEERSNFTDVQERSSFTSFKNLLFLSACFTEFKQSSISSQGIYFIFISKSQVKAKMKEEELRRNRKRIR